MFTAALTATVVFSDDLHGTQVHKNLRFPFNFISFVNIFNYIFTLYPCIFDPKDQNVSSLLISKIN